MIDKQSTTEDRRPSFCLLAHNAAGAMFGGNQGHIGGVERQTSLMARWLAARGYGVSLLTWDEGQADEEIVDGVRVIKMCSRDSGLPGLHFDSEEIRNDRGGIPSSHTSHKKSNALT